MKKIIKALAHSFHWVTKSNRPKHIKFGFYAGLCGTIFAAIGAGLAAEYKDKQYGNKFDWLDTAATIIGGMFGQAAQLLILFGILKLVR
jgi:hypothetical protein|uniref:Putative periplasmic lipoprotein n=1 Tax=Podoviridae sp. ctZkC8 TaxID=2825259 RepID=A0A8S5UBI5_9CAUD|nr:MAG TPA: putative periplasmic lipoprotein [Podoviridae sp. ctZkC8]